MLYICARVHVYLNLGPALLRIQDFLVTLVVICASLALYILDATLINAVNSSHPRYLLSPRDVLRRQSDSVVMTACVGSQLLQKLDVTAATTVILLMSLSTLDSVGAELGGRNCAHKNTRGINLTNTPFV